jgi:hypothetical protein
MLDRARLAGQLSLGRDVDACLGRRDQAVCQAGIRGGLIGASLASLIERLIAGVRPQQPYAGQQGSAERGPDPTVPVLDQPAMQSVRPASTAPATS